MEKVIIPEEYKNYIKEVIEISKRTTKENSILYNFEISDKDIKSKISIIEQSGKNKVVKEGTFAKSEEFFYYFLTPLIKEFSESNNVVFNDIIDMNEDNKTTYRLLTDNNDLFTVNGLTFQDTSYLCDVVEELKRNKTEHTKELALYNNAGKVNASLVIVILLIVSLLIATIT